jgi:hypothetical protein
MSLGDARAAAGSKGITKYCLSLTYALRSIPQNIASVDRQLERLMPSSQLGAILADRRAHRRCPFGRLR